MRWLDKFIEKRLRIKRKAEIERMFIACKKTVAFLREEKDDVSRVFLYDVEYTDEKGSLPLTIYRNSSGASFGIRWNVAGDADWTMIIPQLPNGKDRPYYVLCDKNTKEEFVCMYND